jgi:hypothetical protein
MNTCVTYSKNSCSEVQGNKSGNAHTCMIIPPQWSNYFLIS